MTLWDILEDERLAYAKELLVRVLEPQELLLVAIRPRKFLEVVESWVDVWRGKLKDSHDRAEVAWQYGAQEIWQHGFIGHCHWSKSKRRADEDSPRPPGSNRSACIPPVPYDWATTIINTARLKFELCSFHNCGVQTVRSACKIGRVREDRFRKEGTNLRSDKSWRYVPVDADLRKFGLWNKQRNYGKSQSSVHTSRDKGPCSFLGDFSDVWMTLTLMIEYKPT